MLSASAMIGDQHVNASVVSSKICRKPCVKAKRQQPASNPKASQMTASRLRPDASTRLETIGVTTIFSAKDSADSDANRTSQVPHACANTDQHDKRMGMHETRP